MKILYALALPLLASVSSGTAWAQSPGADPSGALTSGGAASLGTTTSFNFVDFTDVSAFTFNGVASQAADRISVVTNGAGQTASVFHTTPVRIEDGFDTTFEVVWNSVGGEGFAFVLHNDPRGATALGGDGFGLGYGFGQSGTTGPAISNGLVLEFDAVRQGFLSDTQVFETSFHTQGTLPLTENELSSIGRSGARLQSSASVQTVRVRYVPGALELYLAGASSPNLTVPYDHRVGAPLLAGSTVGGLDVPTGEAFVGFTAANGVSSSQNLQIVSWEYTELQPPPACLFGSVLSNGMPFDPILVNGSNGDFFRNLELSIGEPWTVTIDPPAGVAQAPFALLVSLGAADGSSLFPIGTGSLCFSNFGFLDIGAALAPAQLTVPPGVVLTMPITLQAVIASNPGSPMQLDVSNALILDFVPEAPPTVGSFNPTSPVAGQTVQVSGFNFSDFAVVEVGGVPVPSNVLSSNLIEFVAPPMLGCDLGLGVRNPDGNFDLASTLLNASPTIAPVPVPGGSVAGGSFALVAGSGFEPGVTVTIGGVPATVLSSSSTGLLVVSPPGTPGPAPLVITNPNGCFATGVFNYF